MKNNICKLCGKNCGKRRICLVHKEKYPFKSSPKGSMPFDRFLLMNKGKDKIKRVKIISPEEILKEVNL